MERQKVARKVRDEEEMEMEMEMVSGEGEGHFFGRKKKTVNKTGT